MTVLIVRFVLMMGTPVTASVLGNCLVKRSINAGRAWNLPCRKAKGLTSMGMQ